MPVIEFCDKLGEWVVQTDSAGGKLKPVTESRDRIIEAAAELFLGGSFHKVGIAEICEVARVNKGTFYHFFASKLDLLLEVIDRYAAECRSALSGVAASGDTPERKLMALFSVPRVRNEEWKTLYGNATGCFLGNVVLEMGANEPVVRERLEKALCDLTSVMQPVVEDYLKQVLGNEKVSVSAVRDAADIVMTLIQGAQVQAKARNDPAVFDRYAAIAPAMISSATTRRGSEDAD
jgi:TetR/AcrR family transcriptional repressor of nem operon